MRASSASRRVASCSALISSEKIATAPFGTAFGSVARASVDQCPRGAERDLGGERRLAHARPPGQDQQVGRMHPARLRVEVAQARSRGRRRGRRGGTRAPRLGSPRASARSKVTNPPSGAAVGRELEQLALGRLDLLAAIEFRVGAEGVVDHYLADVDELPAQPSIVDRAAILAGVDDADHRGQQLREIGGAADLLQHAGMLELGLQRHRVGELPGFDPARRSPGRCGHGSGRRSVRGRGSPRPAHRPCCWRAAPRAAPAPPARWRAAGAGTGRAAANRVLFIRPP